MNANFYQKLSKWTQCRQCENRRTTDGYEKYADRYEKELKLKNSERGDLKLMENTSKIKLPQTQFNEVN